MNLPPPPAEIARFTDLIGADAMIALIEAHGGVPLRIPARADGSKLAGIIGVEAAERLAAVYGKDVVKVPLCRNWRVRYYHAMGLSLNAIARKIGMTQGTVSAILAGNTKTSNIYQGSLDI